MREQPRTFREERLYPWLTPERLPPRLPLFLLRCVRLSRPPRMPVLCDRVEARQMRGKSEAIPVEEYSTRANEDSYLAIQLQKLASMQPMQRCRAYDRIHLLLPKSAVPGRLTDICFHPTQAPLHVTQDLLSKQQQDGIYVHGDGACLWETR